MAGIRITLKETGQQSIARLWVHTPPESEKKEEPDYLIHFRRPETYDGEFGFDWMRDNYSTICNNYEELKKEYYDCEKNEKVELLKDKEYFVPWISMFPEQNDVNLLLELEKISDKIQDNDYIILKSTKGVSFTPEKIKLKNIPIKKEEKETGEGKKEKDEYLPIEKNKAVIKVSCKKLEKDVCIDILNSKGKCVGKLNVMANNEILSLDIKFVGVCSIKNMKHLEDKFGYHIKDASIDYLKKNSFNQFLVKVNLIEEDFKKIEHINTADIPANMKESYGMVNDEGRKWLKKNCKSKEGFKGIIVFYLDVNHIKSSKAGDADTYPLDDQFLFLYLNSAAKNDLAHEMGHVLGLLHTFKQKEDAQRNKAVLDKNPYKYEEGKTTNIMDYIDDWKRKDFYHWQWLVMREEVKKYYS